ATIIGPESSRLRRALLPRPSATEGLQSKKEEYSMSQHQTYQDALDAPEAEPWRPEVGEKLVGEVVEVDEFTGDYGTAPTVTIQPEDGGEPLKVFGFGTVLKDKIERANPQVGDIVGVKF